MNEEEGLAKWMEKKKKNVNLWVLRPKHWFWQMEIVFDGEKEERRIEKQAGVPMSF